jgi:hypothetical protein
LNYLLNDKLNQKLPPFINLGKLKMMWGVNLNGFSNLGLNIVLNQSSGL